MRYLAAAALLSLACSATAAPRRILITGAASGIGRALALQLAREKARIAVTDIQTAKLLKVADELRAAGAEVLALPGDVRDMRAVRRQYAAIRREWGGLDWAILNAGIRARQSAWHFKARLYDEMWETNVGGVVNWMEEVLPDMVSAGRGTVAGISSQAAARGFATGGAYGSSKAALSALLESTRVDLRGSGVNIVTVHPGWVRTPMTAAAGLDPTEMPYMMEADEAAAYIIAGLSAGRREVNFPWQMTLRRMYIFRNLPDPLLDWLAARSQRARSPSSSRPAASPPAPVARRPGAARRVLITGATSPLGRALAMKLAGSGANVAVAGAAMPELEALVRGIALAGGHGLALPGDSADPKAVARGYASIRSSWGGLDWAVLCETAMEGAPVPVFKAQPYYRLRKANVAGAVNWMEAILPDMLATGNGTIAGVSSLAAWRGLPRLGPYSASQAALSYMLEAVRVELNGTGVRVLIIHPSFKFDAEEAAERLLEAISGGKRRVSFPWREAALMSIIVRPLPNFLYDPFALILARALGAP